MGDGLAGYECSAPTRWTAPAIAAALDRGRSAAPPSARLLCLSLGVPLYAAERLLSLQHYPNAVLWSPAPEHEYAGVGAARVLVATGVARFAVIEEEAAKLFAQLIEIDVDCVPPPEIRIVGGFAFAGTSTSRLWRSFDDARFLLPRIVYERRGSLAWLRLTATAAELARPAQRQRLGAEAHRALQALRDAGPGRAVAEPVVVAEAVATAVAAAATTAGQSTRRAAKASWRRLLAGIGSEIAAGRLEKAVAARRIVLAGPYAHTEAVVLAALRGEAPRCTRFALRHGASCFLGASPELLLRQTGRAVWTEATAGTVAGDDLDADHALMSSAKDRGEQALVVRDIQAVLAARCRILRVAGPALQRLQGLRHLRTRFSGVLAEPAHVLRLLARLHPTAAIGGTPRAAALAWLDAHERSDRGYYGGPFGVIGPRGDGEFVVAIRSGLLATAAAHVFAGAGIVASSDSETEWRETEAKSAALLAALSGAFERRPT